jgi:ubiquinone/menaquinone biosynthesis C-methylase UbiE
MDDITDSYEMVEDPLYLNERRGRELTFARHLQTLERHTGPAEGRRLLDVGAYVGVFVEEALKTRWDAWGVEPSHWAAKYAQQRELNVVQGTLDDVPFKPESFDAITMWDVIEHVPDPKRMMAQSYELLKPGGWIAVHTMDIDSLLAKLMGKRWPWLMEMHIVYFSRTTLSNMLESVGFNVAEVPAQGRYLRLNYLITRLRPYSRPLANAVEGAATTLGLIEKPIPINFGDLVTAFAQKPTARR